MLKSKRARRKWWDNLNPEAQNAYIENVVIKKALKRKRRTLRVMKIFPQESIVIGDDIEIIVIDVRGDKVRLGITAPKKVPVHRKEVYDTIQAESGAHINICQSCRFRTICQDNPIDGRCDEYDKESPEKGNVTHGRGHERI